MYAQNHPPAGAFACPEYVDLVSYLLGDQGESVGLEMDTRPIRTFQLRSKDPNITSGSTCVDAYTERRSRFLVRFIEHLEREKIIRRTTRSVRTQRYSRYRSKLESLLSSDYVIDRWDVFEALGLKGPDTPKWILHFAYAPTEQEDVQQSMRCIERFLDRESSAMSMRSSPIVEEPQLIGLKRFNSEPFSSVQTLRSSLEQDSRGSPLSRPPLIKAVTTNALPHASWDQNLSSDKLPADLAQNIVALLEDYPDDKLTLPNWSSTTPELTSCGDCHEISLNGYFSGQVKRHFSSIRHTHNILARLILEGKSPRETPATKERRVALDLFIEQNGRSVFCDLSRLVPCANGLLTKRTGGHNKLCSGDCDAILEVATVPDCQEDTLDLINPTDRPQPESTIETIPPISNQQYVAAPAVEDSMSTRMSRSTTVTTVPSFYFSDNSTIHPSQSISTAPSFYTSDNATIPEDYPSYKSGLDTPDRKIAGPRLSKRASHSLSIGLQAQLGAKFDEIEKKMETCDEVLRSLASESGKHDKSLGDLSLKLDAELGGMKKRVETRDELLRHLASENGKHDESLNDLSSKLEELGGVVDGLKSNLLTENMVERYIGPKVEHFMKGMKNDMDGQYIRGYGRTKALEEKNEKITKTVESFGATNHELILAVGKLKQDQVRTDSLSSEIMRSLGGFAESSAVSDARNETKIQQMEEAIETQRVNSYNLNHKLLLKIAHLEAIVERSKRGSTMTI